MTPRDLLAELTTLGVRLTVQGERLRVQAPTGVLTDELRQAMTRCKAELMELLSGPNEINEINEPSRSNSAPSSFNSLISSPDADAALMADTTTVLARWRS